jgi:hypothetical protein
MLPEQTSKKRFQNNSTLQQRVEATYYIHLTKHCGLDFLNREIIETLRRHNIGAVLGDWRLRSCSYCPVAEKPRLKAPMPPGLEATGA